jgi:hypothetical protein
MSWLRRLLGREKSHEQWLAEHPGKSSDKYVEAEFDEEERDRIRAGMERDMEQARERRDAE